MRSLFKEDRILASRAKRAPLALLQLVGGASPNPFFSSFHDGGAPSALMEQTSFEPLLLFLFSTGEIRTEDLFHVRFVDGQFPHFLPCLPVIRIGGFLVGQ